MVIGPSTELVEHGHSCPGRQSTNGGEQEPRTLPGTCAKRVTASVASIQTPTRGAGNGRDRRGNDFAVLPGCDAGHSGQAALGCQATGRPELNRLDIRRTIASSYACQARVTAAW